jgi:hypothetical protein
MYAIQGITMNLENPKGSEPTVSAKTKVRRTFLKRASASVLISSLPAKSVWGACNTSGVSGGSSTTATCELPIVTNGRSPGFWGRFTSNFKGNFSDASFNDVFTSYAHESDDVIADAKCNLTQYLRDTTIVLSEGNSVIPAATLNLYEALSNNGGIWNLAAYYLNAKFGLYTIPLPFDNAEELVEHVWGVLSIQQGGGVPTDYESLTASFTNGSTVVYIPSGVGCSVEPDEDPGKGKGKGKGN